MTYFNQSFEIKFRHVQGDAQLIAFRGLDLFSTAQASFLPVGGGL